MDWLLDPFAPQYMQRALLEVVLLAVAGGLLGTWVILRRLAFFTHAVGTATFPALVLAAPVGVAPPVAALGAGLGFSGALVRLARGGRTGVDTATGLLLVGALAAGVILASDLVDSGTAVDRALFGTLIGLDGLDLALSAIAAGGAVLATLALGRTWTAIGFDPAAAGALGLRVTAADWLLLAAIAGAVVTALAAVGALLVGAVFVVPAATARLLATRVSSLAMLAVLIAAVEGVAGVWLAHRLDAPPGPAIAALAAVAYFLAALATRSRT